MDHVLWSFVARALRLLLLVIICGLWVMLVYDPCLFVCVCLGPVYLWFMIVLGASVFIVQQSKLLKHHKKKLQYSGL